MCLIRFDITKLNIWYLKFLIFTKLKLMCFIRFDIYKRYLIFTKNIWKIFEVDVLDSIWYLQNIFDIYKKKYLKDIWSWCAWFDLIFTKLIKRVGWFYCLDKIQISIWYLIVDIWYFDIWYLIFTYWDQFEVDVLDSIWYLQSSSKEWDASTALIAFKYLFHKILLEIGLTLL